MSQAGPAQQKRSLILAPATSVPQGSLKITQGKTTEKGLVSPFLLKINTNDTVGALHTWVCWCGDGEGTQADTDHPGGVNEVGRGALAGLRARV